MGHFMPPVESMIRKKVAAAAFGIDEPANQRTAPVGAAVFNGIDDAFDVKERNF